MSQWLSVNDDVKDVNGEFGYQVLKVPALTGFPVVQLWDF